MQSTRPASAAILLLMFGLLTTAPAQTFKVLHTFKGAPSDGQGPFGVVIRDSAGNLYGTTEAGGTGKWDGTGTCGTLFKLNKTGKEVAHMSFHLASGCQPRVGLLRDAQGNFFGTTLLGGDTQCYQFGCGTVFKVSKTGKGTLLHRFTGTPDGWFPEALLVEDEAGNLYGTTTNGGAFDNGGTIFKVDSKGNESILYNFCSEMNCVDGSSPAAGLARDSSANLYGVAGGGLNGAGVVYELDASGRETVLYNFTGGSDGDGPTSVLILDSQGNLYGTTEGGGNFIGDCEALGCGVVFEVSPQPGGSWKETTLYKFCSQANCTDGERPAAGPLVRDAAGNLYGSTYFGGKSSFQCNGSCGLVFKLDPTGRETVLHSFTGGTDGAFPWAGLTMDLANNLYGTAAGGGDTACPGGCGVVFGITP
jgi:uncharacterized repeat protein (TIGR03803 family)